MAKPTLITGILLIVVGLIGYFMGTPSEDTGVVSKTALIPAYFGIVLTILGGVALKVTGKGHMHVMHVAVLVGLLGLIGSGMRIPKSVAAVNEGAGSLPLYMQSAMAVLCLVFVILCVRSFVVARLKRKSS